MCSYPQSVHKYFSESYSTVPEDNLFTSFTTFKISVFVASLTLSAFTKYISALVLATINSVTPK